MRERPIVTVPDERWLDLWPGQPAPVDLHVWDLRSAPLVDPEVVVAPYMGPADALHSLSQATSLRLVQLLTAGYDSALAMIPPGVALANAAGVHDTSTAELAVGLSIAALRGFADFARAQPQGQWLAGTRPALADRRVLVIGSGAVGSAIVARLAPFEVQITRVGARERDDALGHVHGADDVMSLLPHHDVVILAVPLTAQTRGMIGPKALAAMAPGALLVNVSRGPVVNTDALVVALQAGRVQAALDVTDPEPLPAEHPLWRCPNVLISPHVGGDTSAFVPRARALLREQLTRYACGQGLMNMIQP